MAETVFDIREFIDDKRIYKSLLGHELNLSFMPSGLIEMFKKYTELEKEIGLKFVKNQNMQKTILETTVKLNKEPITDEVTAGLQDMMNSMNKESEEQFQLTRQARELGINMIMVAAQSNKQEFVTKEWIEKEIDGQEFGYLLKFIMKQEKPADVKKK